MLLYTVLVLVPALVLGGLLYHQLVSDHSSQLDELPRDVRDTAARLRSGIENRVLDLLASENAREFYHYNQDFWERGTVADADGRSTLTPIPSPLALDPRPPGILAWFSWNITDPEGAEPLLQRGGPHISPGLTPSEEVDLYSLDAARGPEQETFVREVLMLRDATEPLEALTEELRVRESIVGVPYPIELLALNLGLRRDPECLHADIGALRESIGDLETLRVHTGDLEIQGHRDEEGNLHLIALRKIYVEPLPALVSVPVCFKQLGGDTLLAQGFELDREWLLREMPQAAATVILGPGMRFLGVDDHIDQEDPDLVLSSFNLFDELDINLDSPEDFALAEMAVAFPNSELKSQLRAQLIWLLGVGVVMIISLVVGVQLLRGSVRSSQARAQQTENFVAAVTHELRTPLAAVKMYGEMLRDGWTDNQEQREEYLTRIVRETDRLDGLVDRLLESRRLAEVQGNPVPGSLNDAVRAAMPAIQLKDGTRATDLSFELAAGLPPVLLADEAVRAILVNLVENARKYAPAEPGGPPLLVRTRLSKRGRVLLEVADRGPGIPSSERTRIFDAFYRIGDESTRSARGTGLGLHLVRMQAKAIRAKAQVGPREGGGTIFRVTFKTLRPSSPTS